MATSNAAKLNNNGITIFPVAFLGKKRDVKMGALNFKPKDGRRSLLPSRKVALAVINKINTVYDGLVKITYKLLDELAGIKHNTAWSSLKELEADNYIESNGESHYSIKSEFTNDEFVVLYDFLLTEKLDCGKGIVKKLSRNAVIQLCNIISFYLNEDNKYKYFIGGDKRTASFLNVAQGTANGVNNELMSVGAITCHKAHYDSAKNIILENGKGKSIAEFTVYKVNPKLLSRCKRIKQYYADKRKEKTEATEQARQVTEQSEQTAKAEQNTQPKKPYRKRKTQATARPKGIIDEWAGTIAKLRAQAQQLAPDEEFTQHDEQPPNDNK